MVHGNLQQVSHPPDHMPWHVPTLKFTKQSILVDSAGHARISDIGISTLVPNDNSRFDWATVGAGGHRWVAPEIFKGGILSEKSDVFSYGFLAAEVRFSDCHVKLPQPTFPRYP